MALWCGAFASTTTSCDPAAAARDGVTLLRTCTPEISFYVPGSAAIAEALVSTLSTDGLVFDRSKPLVRINTTGPGIAFAYYG